jgi:hypothetical protein
VRRFSLASLLAAALSTLALVSPPTAAAQEVPDANCPGPPGGTFIANIASTRVAQTFTALNTGKLVRARVLIFGGGTADHVLSIHTVDAAGVPADSVLATTTVPSPPEGQHTIEGEFFAAPADVVAGQQYALVLSRPGGGGMNVRVRFDNPCPGAVYSRTGSGPFSEHFGVDMVFAVFVIPTPGAATEQLTCKGERATIAGTPQGEKFEGTPGRDVIAALGGNDKVFGLAGKDLICGGSGKDKLTGGAGKDTLLGQAGKDTLKGGGAKDICKGGKGNDSGSCEVEKSL